MTTLLRLMAWLSPSFPVGAYSYSHGLEWAVEAGLVRDRATASDWIATLVEAGAGRSDAALLLEAHRAAAAGDRDRLDRIAELAGAMRPTAELALEAGAQGTAFLAALATAWPDPWLDAWHRDLKGRGGGAAYAVAVGAATARAGIAETDALSAFLHAFAANLVSAAVRLVPLGQTDGQRMVATLEGVVTQAAEAALTRPLADIGSAVPVLDWCSMNHETQYTRVYRS
ncbi:urease accessory protein UreF [Magnetospirillum sp. UT-4]|uniref:urease accessory protein UreF n=1 Tax=Magnetospirillum sp. UT-4 TaxID=2681467 RepID=UPI001383BBDF|nr:urease accessory protein UreF [Magnetospirillum sp. UT-4]CAA7625380.1 Urease accessory protein UreF [Magnetospirillum sp. UT-4]